MLKEKRGKDMPKINREEHEHINWLLKRVKKEIKRKDENLGLLDWNSRQEDILIIGGCKYGNNT